MIYTKTIPRKWEKQDIEKLLELKNQKKSISEMARELNRTEVAISIKLKRLNKKNNTYNKDHIIEKYKLNNDFLNTIKPKTILDLYCGEKNFYKEYLTTTNDKNKGIDADYHEDAYKLICRLYYEEKKYDLIDLDPFGSAYDCFDLAIKMAKKGIIITLGELGHKRFKRLDYVKTHYDINTMEDFTIENIISYIKKIGLRNKKELVVWKYKEWKTTGRVYFMIKDYKVLEQWNKPSEIKIKKQNILETRINKAMEILSNCTLEDGLSLLEIEDILSGEQDK